MQERLKRKIPAKMMSPVCVGRRSWCLTQGVPGSFQLLNCAALRRNANRIHPLQSALRTDKNIPFGNRPRLGQTRQRAGCQWQTCVEGSALPTVGQQETTGTNIHTCVLFDLVEKAFLLSGVVASTSWADELRSSEHDHSWDV